MKRGGKEGIDMQLREMDEQVTYMQQLQEDTGPIVLVNVFNVAPEDAEKLVRVPKPRRELPRERRRFPPRVREGRGPRDLLIA
jgi:hypothetical protein